MLRTFTALAIILTILVTPISAWAQSQQPVEPGQDPFALTPEKLRLFQGYESPNDDVQSMFDGQNMKDNGLFTQSLTQLGGAAPPPVHATTGNTPPPPPTTDPEANNGQQGNFIMISSKYSPNTGLTHESKIAVTVTVKNVSDHPIDDILFTAKLKDQNADLLDDPEPEPNFDEGPELGEAIEDPMVWDKFDLDPQEEKVFTWSIQAHEDDSILRWTFTAQFGAGQSILILWIPIQNPNPVGGGTGAGGSGIGIGTACSTPGVTTAFPESAGGTQLVSMFMERWKLRLVDGAASWANPAYRPVLKIYWDTLTSVECTQFITTITAQEPNGYPIVASDSSCMGFLWGERGGGCNPAGLALGLDNILGGVNRGISANVAQNWIHELGHAYSFALGRGGNVYQDYLANICHGTEASGCSNPITGYGGTQADEGFADMVGFYVVRCGVELFDPTINPNQNPYDVGHQDYYNWAKTNVFGGKEFGKNC